MWKRWMLLAFVGAARTREVHGKCHQSGRPPPRLNQSLPSAMNSFSSVTWLDPIKTCKLSILNKIIEATALNIISRCGSILKRRGNGTLKLERGRKSATWRHFRHRPDENQLIGRLQSLPHWRISSFAPFLVFDWPILPRPTGPYQLTNNQWKW